MIKAVTASVLASAMSLMVLGTASSASAGERLGDCCGLGPIAPSYVYRTVHPVTHVTRFHDVSRTRYVERQHPIVHVTQVQPVVVMHDVTRVHYRTVPFDYPVYYSATQVLPTQMVVTHGVESSDGCSCQYPRYGSYDPYLW